MGHRSECDHSAKNIAGLAPSSVGKKVGEELDIWNEIHPKEGKNEKKIERKLQKPENRFLEIHYNQI